MFSLSSHSKLVRSIASSPIQYEPLEGRRFLSASSLAVDVLDLDAASVNVPQASAESLVAAASSPKLVKIEGNYPGHYTSVNSKIGTDSLTFTITHDTRTGHFVGSFVIHTHPAGTFTGSVTGVVHTNKHVTLNIVGPKITGTFIGIASRTGGSINGTYDVLASGAGDHGKFHIGKT